MRILAIICVLVLFGCNSERKLQKAEAKLDQAGRLPKICANRYPTKDSIIIKDSVYYDTLHEGEYIFDTLRINDTIRITKNKIVTKVVTKQRIVFQENTAEVEKLKGQLTNCVDSKNQQLITDQTKIKLLESKTKQIYYYWLIIALLLIWIFRKPIFKPFL